MLFDQPADVFRHPEEFHQIRDQPSFIPSICVPCRSVASQQYPSPTARAARVSAGYVYKDVTRAVIIGDCSDTLLIHFSTLLPFVFLDVPFTRWRNFDQ